MKRKTIIVCMAIAITIALPLITFSAIYISDKAKMKKINDAICDCYVAAESNHQELLCSSLIAIIVTLPLKKSGLLDKMKQQLNA